MHMTQSSMMMMGSKLDLKFLTDQHAGLGTKYRWAGKMMGFRMDFTVEVTKWIPGEEKTWETIGTPQLIIYSWYRMHLLLTRFPGGRYIGRIVHQLQKASRILLPTPFIFVCGLVLPMVFKEYAG